MGRLVADAVAQCTPLQRRYLQDYYQQRLTLEEIGARYGVDKSTVSRTVKRARARVESHITARLLLGRCVDERGRFDYMKFLHSARLLTERQKEMVYLILARDTSYRDIAAYIGRKPATVRRTAERAEERLESLSVTVDRRYSSVRLERADWLGRDEKTLAEDLGLSAAFYYRIVRRGERVGDIPLLHCAILNRLAAGESRERVAGALGCSKELVGKVGRAHPGVRVPSFTEDYRPKGQTKARLPENPFAALGGGTVLDAIDAATYRKLQERFGPDL